MEEDYLILKWGTIKGWRFEKSPEAWEALCEYHLLGFCASRMMQEDTPRHKELICIMIDTVRGQVKSGFDGTDWTDDRAAAKKYVMNYGK